ncbi:TPA: hypothetical protein N0F65_010459 [Lagenidium giganteum]|uniref:Integrase catalytic domain-containing protein n=1 Tax=Lagenidium giganteum TaxID=4803 RepID=A0AAV2YGG4_9STRA|nr:TPA: hypothetical protein N0F65_010459 [Lagenidium giganteum]
MESSIGHVTCVALCDGLCALRVNNSHALAVRPTLTLDLLHQRFGHANKQTLAKMAGDKLVTSIRLEAPTTTSSPCAACELGCKCRSTFKPATRQGVHGCNSVVHNDIAGPVEIPSLKLERYVLKFVYVYSRYCTIKLLCKRLEFLQHFLKYKASVETLHNRSVQRFISDNGGKFASSAFIQYCKDHGIQRETTISHTPEQNGLAEVRFRILSTK